MRVLWGLGIALLCVGCVTTETVRFVPRAAQDSLTRDGVAGIVSRGKDSLVMVWPAARRFAAGGRPTFVVGLNNLGRSPIEFRVADISVNQIAGEQVTALKIYTYDELVAEERSRQVAAAILAGVAAGANAASASYAGRYNSTSTIYGPNGRTYIVNTSGYSPTAAAIAQSDAAARNEAMISATIERGQQNLAALERAIIKDNTLLPGEWYGGQLVLSPPESQTGGKTYSIVVRAGSDVHEIGVVQSEAR